MKKNGFWHNLKHSINSIILCIRFPFLYPRNRWTNTHYYNYKIQELARKLHKESTHLDTTYWKVIIDNKPKYWLSNAIEWFHDYPLQLFHCIPTYTELDAMPSGWKDAFGIELCKELRKLLIANHCLFSYRIVQIKEKWGELRWYDNMYTITNPVVDKYTELSQRTCFVCGKPAKWITPLETWRCPYCDEHVPKNIVKEFLTEIK